MPENNTSCNVCQLTPCECREPTKLELLEDRVLVLEERIQQLKEEGLTDAKRRELGWKEMR